VAVGLFVFCFKRYDKTLNELPQGLDHFFIIIKRFLQADGTLLSKGCYQLQFFVGQSLGMGKIYSQYPNTG
jgi:hypothetical protein